MSTRPPSLAVGTTTFHQHIFARSSTRSSGTVMVENHFTAWRDLGSDLGSFSYQLIAVEGWGGEGANTRTVTN